MPSLQIYLFGAPQVERKGQSVNITRRKAVALLAYLVTTNEAHSRDLLATMFWPEYDQSAARANLRRDLSRLNKGLGTGVIAADRYQVAFHLDAGSWLDVAVFRSHLDLVRAHDHFPQQSCPLCLNACQEAVSLYAADFMAGFSLPDSPQFDEWQFFQAESLRNALAELLQRLIQWHASQREYLQGIEYGRRWLSLDTLHEPAHRQLMVLYAWAGQHAAALRQYAECVRVLEEELGVEPEAQTTALYEEIRTRQIAPQPPIPEEQRAVGETVTPPPTIRYQIESLLAVGGQGEVYLGRDLESGSDVVIKRLKPELIQADPEYLARFLREGEILRQLNHPNIVQLLGMFEQDGQTHLVMEHVPGGSLRQLLDSDLQLTPDRAIGIALELADALGRAHHLGVIHRDLKPENILLAEDGTPRLTDFGIASQESGDARLTRAGSLLGSPAYMSPEALQGEPVDARSDIWSFGAVLFEMLAGVAPFGHEQIATTLLKILQEPTPNLLQLQPDTPLPLDRLVHRMLIKDRRQRLGSMRQVAAALEAIRDDLDMGDYWMIPLPSQKVVAEAGDRPTELDIDRIRLPIQLTPLVGREEEIDQIRQLVAEEAACRLLTLTGPGGIGKTQLAIAAAWRLSDRFRDGVYYVPLRSIADQAVIVPAIAEALDLQFTGATTPKIQLLHHLRAKTMLLLIDNLELQPGAAELIQDILGFSQGVKILAISSEQLGLQEAWHYEVRGLASPALVTADADSLATFGASQLFIQRAGRADARFTVRPDDIPAVVNISRLLQGTPLSLELVAPWVCDMSCAEIAAEIKRGLDQGLSAASATAGPQHGLQVVYRQIGDTLSASEKELLGRLSVFRGGCSLEALEAATGASMATVATLVERALLARNSDGRYLLHEQTIQFAARQLQHDPEEKESALDCHSNYYLGFLAQRTASIKGRQQVAALTEITAEIDNVRAAWRHAVSRRQIEALAEAAEGYWLYSEFRGIPTEGESAFRYAAEALASLAEQPGDAVDSLTGFLRTGEGCLMARRGWVDEGVKQMEVGVNQLRRAGSPDRHREAFALAQLAFALVTQGRYSEADGHAQVSLELFPETNDHWTRALALRLRGVVAQFTGRLDEAEEHLHACLTTCAQIDERRIQAYARAQMGQIALLHGDYGRAGQWFDQAAELNRQMGNRLGKADRLREQGMLAMVQGDYARAGDMLEESQAISVDIGRSDAGVTLCYLGMVWQRMGDLDKARQLYQESLAAANAAGDQAAVANCLQQMGHLAYEQGRLGPAEQLLQESLALWQQIGNEAMISAVVCHLGHVMARSTESRGSEAQQYYRQALQLALKHRLVPVSLDAMTGLASLLVHSDAAQQAIQLLILVEKHAASTQITRDAASQQLAALSPILVSSGRGKQLLDWQEAAVALVTQLDRTGWQPLMVPSNLPSEIAPLVGREREVAEVRQLLLGSPRSRLITLTGPGGVGKTRLALAVARGNAANFPAGVFTLALTPFDSESEILARLADHMGMRFHDQAEPITQLLAYLRDKKMLLVLDNFEHLLAGTSQITQILQSTSQVQILATSQQSLNLTDEVTFRLSGLTLPDTTDREAAFSSEAVTLFLQHASISTTQLDRRPEYLEAIARSCRLAAGMPLAIILMAGWTKTLSPPKIADEIARHLRIPENDPQGVVLQQRSMQAVLAATWAQLKARQQHALGKLALFRSGFTWAAAEAVAGVSRRELLALSSQSWLSRDADNRFQMHELVRQFIQQELTASVEAYAEARQRYLQYHVALMRQQYEKMSGAEQLQGFATVAAEFDNTRVAWNWLLADGQVGSAVEDLLPALFRYSETRHDIAALMPQLTAARDRLRSLDPAAADNRRLLAILLTAQAAFYRNGFPIRFEAFGMSPAADAESIVRAWQTTDEGDLLARMGFWGIVLSYIYGRIVDPQTGIVALRQLNVISRETDQRWLLGLGLEFLALLLQRDHDDASNHAEIEECINEALALFQVSGDKRESGYALRALGQLRRSQRAFDEAIWHWQAAQAKLQTAGDKRMAADLYWAMGDAYLQIGRFDDAFRSYRKMSRAYLEMGITRFAAEILSKESYEAVRYSSLDHARQTRQQSLNMSRETGDRLPEAWSTWEMGEIYRVMGELEKARHWYENARQLFDEFDDRTAYIFYHRGLGDLDYTQGNYWEAQEQFWHSLEYAREADHDWGIAYARAGLGRASLALNQKDTAREHFVRSLIRGIRANEQGIILFTLADVANYYAASGDSDQAVTLASQILRHPASWRETKMKAEAILAQHAPAAPGETTAVESREQQPDVWQTAAKTLASLEGASSWRPAMAKSDSLLDRSASLQRLPVHRSPFIGRLHELEEIRHHLLEARLQLLIVIGPGGIGKTRLAVEIATRSGADYEHGVVYVPLAPLEAGEQIAGAVAESLGFHNFTADEPRQQVLDYLQNKKVLLILDNYEHLLPDTTLVSEILAHAPDVQILVTTRQRLNLGSETVYPLTGMPYPQKLPLDEAELKRYDAVKLLLDQTRLVRPDYQLQPEDLEQLIRICQMVQGMPLALVLAAGWLDMLSFAEIADEIERSLDFLESERRDLPERQRSVRAVFDGSWARLAPAAQAVMARLAVFRGGFTRQAARAISGADLRTLRTLVNSSFVTINASGRYEIHELLRQYSFEQLTAMGEADATRSAHSAHFLTFMQEREADLKGRRQPEALFEIETELRNVRSAWNWASSNRLRSQIDGALETLHLFCDLRGRHQEGAALFAQAREHLAPEAAGEPDATWPRLLIRHGFLRIFVFSQRTAVLEDLQLGLRLAQEQANQAEIAIAHQAFGTLSYTAEQEPETALKHFEESHLLFSALNDPFYLARALVGMGYCYTMLADTQRSEAFTREGLAITRQIGSKVDESVALANLAEMELGQGKYERAELSFRQAITITEQLKSAAVKAYCLPFSNLITILHGDLTAAESGIRAGLSVAEEVNFPVAIAYAQAILGIYEGLAGNYETSQRWAEQSIANPGNNTMGLVLAPWGLALAHCGQQQWQKAERALARALLEAGRLMYPALPLWLLPVAAVLAAKQGQTVSAVELLAVASSHPLRATGWMKRWSPLKDLQTNLEQELGHNTYLAAWDRGKEMDIEAAVAEALSLIQPGQDQGQSTSS